MNRWICAFPKRINLKRDTNSIVQDFELVSLIQFPMMVTIMLSAPSTLYNFKMSHYHSEIYILFFVAYTLRKSINIISGNIKKYFQFNLSSLIAGVKCQKKDFKLMKINLETSKQNLAHIRVLGSCFTCG